MMFLSQQLNALSGPGSSCLSAQGQGSARAKELGLALDSARFPRSVTVLSRVLDDSLKDTRRPFTDIMVTPQTTPPIVIFLKSCTYCKFKNASWPRSAMANL